MRGLDRAARPLSSDQWRTGSRSRVSRMLGISFVELPIPDHAFFEQPVLKGQFGDHLLQGGRFRPQIFDFGRCRLACRVACKTVLAGLQELLRPGIVQALSNPLAAAQRGNAFFAAQTSQDDPDLLLGRVVLARLAFNASDQLVSGILRCSGFLIHLRSLMASMNQKSSVAQTPNSVRWALTSDTT